MLNCDSIMKTITTILLIAIVIALGVHILHISISGYKEKLQEEVVQNDVEPTTNAEQEIMTEIRSLGAKRDSDNLPVLKKHLHDDLLINRHMPGLPQTL